MCRYLRRRNRSNAGNELELTSKGNDKYTFTMPAGTVKVKAGFVPIESAGTPWVNPFDPVRIDRGVRCENVVCGDFLAARRCCIPTVKGVANTGGGGAGDNPAYQPDPEGQWGIRTANQ